MVAQSVEQQLPSPRELATENAVRSMRFVEWPALVPNGPAEVLRGVLILEAFDAFALGSLKQKANHHVVEATVHEIIDDCA